MLRLARMRPAVKFHRSNPELRKSNAELIMNNSLLPMMSESMPAVKLPIEYAKNV